MKKLQKILMALILIGIVGACTSDFDDINKNPSKIGASDLGGTAKYLLTKPQYKLYAPDRYPYWRAQLIHGDRFAGYFTFGFNGSWWGDGLGYSFDAGYTDAALDWLLGLNGDIFILLDQTDVGAPLEDANLHAMGLILKGLYYQMFTDIVGDLPYNNVDNVDVVPAFDSQSAIYEGVIAELDEAMASIGDATSTGEGVLDVGSNDLYYGGDLQMWKKLANTLKLRMALRAYGASNADFAATAITEALSGDLLEAGEDALLAKDVDISQWNAASYGDVWHNFGLGSNWKVGEPVVKYLRDNNDPRLDFYTKPAAGGRNVVRSPNGVAADEKRFQYILDHLTNSGVVYTVEDSSHTEGGTTSNFKIVDFAANTYYIGQPPRFSDFTYDFAHDSFFSEPADLITAPKGSDEIFNELIFTAAESYFLQAEAAFRGLGSGNANDLYQSGIRASMQLWGVDAPDIDTYITDEAEATLQAGRELEQIATQRWIAVYTDGFEGWAVVRKSGYPADLAAGISDVDIFNPGSINGNYPQRMRYGSAFRNTNGTNLDAAIARQGPDVQDTELWWAK